MRFEFETERGSQALYLQLANALEAHIVEQRLGPGTQLPSEPTLAAENQLSRATILKAFEVLMDRGLVERRRGKGTFVRSRPMERKLPELSSFSEHIESLGLAPSNALLNFAVFEPGAAGRPASPYADDVPLVMLERLRNVDGGPVGLQRLIVPEYVASRIGLDERAAAQADFSFYRALREAGIRLAGGEETLRAINAEPADAEVLAVPNGTALIEIARESRDHSGALIEHVRARYLGENYLYRVTLNRLPDETPDPGSHQAARPGGGYHPDTASPKPSRPTPDPMEHQ